MNEIIFRLANRASLWARLSKKASISTKNVWIPDITISREPGSGGKVVASMVAKKLKWKLLDKELLVKLAQQFGIPEDEFGKIDEKPRSWLLDSFNSLFNPSYVSDWKYIQHLKTLIRTIAKEAPVVIVGRGANFVLPPDKVLRVRVTASWANRVAYKMKYEHLSRAKAEELVNTISKKRNDFVRQYFNKEADNVDNYDLTINTDHLSLETARDMIIGAFYDKFPKVQKKQH